VRWGLERLELFSNYYIPSFQVILPPAGTQTERISRPLPQVEVVSNLPTHRLIFARWWQHQREASSDNTNGKQSVRMESTPTGCWGWQISWWLLVHSSGNNSLFPGVRICSHLEIAGRLPLTL